MRILFVILTLASLLTFVKETYANPGFQFDQATISSEYKENQGIKTVLSSKFEGNWSWLLFHLSSRLYLQTPQDNYSTVITEYEFPEISRNLTFYLSDQWNHSYNLVAAVASYQWPLFNDLELECAVGNKIRSALKTDNQKYQYFQDSQEIKLDFSPKNWRYWLQIIRTNKHYADYGYLSAEKVRLDQNISWRSSSFKVGLGLKEETGDYPNDQPETEQDRNYWKQKWSVDGRKDFGEENQLTWEYSNSYHIKGFNDPYRTGESLELKWISTPIPDWEFSIQTKYARLYYASSTPEYYDPGYISDNEDDLYSRLERKLNISCKHTIDKLTIEVDYYFGDYQYTQKAMESSSGLHATLEWNLDEYKEYTLSFKIAPIGDLRHRSGFYQFKLDYKPKKQKRESKLGDLDKIYEIEEETF